MKRRGIQKQAGAPMGGRVHWLLMFLPKEFLRAYKLRFDYEYHNYYFARHNESGRAIIDEFIIIRTSRNCFRVMYFNQRNTYFEYFSEETAKATADHIGELYEKIRRAEAQGL